MRFEFHHYAFLGENSSIAARASECAAQQDLFWEFHDTVFEVHGVDSFGSINNKRIAEEVGADKISFDKCLDQGRTQKYVDLDFELGRSMGVGSTPYVFINDRPIKGLYEFADYDQVIQEELGNAEKTAIGDTVAGSDGCAATETECE